MKFLFYIYDRFLCQAQPTYGPRIFAQRSWLTKQVDEAQRRRAYEI